MSERTLAHLSVPLLFLVLGSFSCGAPAHGPGGVSGQEPAADSGRQPDLPATPPLRAATALWAYALRDAAKGLALHPVTGRIFVSVGPSEGAFARTGGLLMLSPGGIAEATLPLPQESPFVPNIPLVSRDGSTIYVGDSEWNLFRFETATGRASRVPLAGSRGSQDATARLSIEAALSPDAGRIYVPGAMLHALDLREGRMEPVLNAGTPVRQAVPLEDDVYLLNLATNDYSPFPLAVWSPRARGLFRIPYDLPVQSLASSQGWTLALTEKEDYCAITELEAGLGYFGASVLGVFQAEPTRPRCAGLSLALNPARRQVAVVGSSALRAVSEAAPRPGDERHGLLLDFANKTYLALDVKKARNAAFSPDGATLTVCDESGLRSFRP
ncbi:MAG: hypothetical protein NDJ89_00085 [Oligoflexia bacterium]|nr:hypothetical protein [Oligoflexia bacterium]